MDVPLVEGVYPILQAGLLAYGSELHFYVSPSFLTGGQGLPVYSGATAAGFHRLPYSP